MDEVNAYFKQYATALLSCDASTLPPYYHSPCLIHDPDGVHALNSDQAVIEYESPLLQALKENKLDNINADIKTKQACPGMPNAVYCSVGYLFQDKDNKTLLDLDFNYTLIKTNQTLKILFGQCGEIREDNL